MPEKLTPETEHRIRELCRNISVAHNLDEEIRAELYSHMEDKLLGYLSGEEKVTEDDALLLVKEHFGNPGILKSLLQDVHVAEIHASLFRRAGVVLATSLALNYIGSICFVLVYSLLSLFVPGSELSRLPERAIPFLGYLLPFILHAGIPVLLLWVILTNWKKRMDTGERLWFYTVGVWKFIAIIAVCIMLPVVLLHFMMSTWYSTHSRYIMDIMALGGYSHYGWLQVFQLSIPLIQCVIWLWWLDSRPRQRRPVLIGLLTWIGYMLYPSFVSLFAFGGARRGMDTPGNLLMSAGAVSLMSLFAFFLYLACVRSFDTYRAYFSRITS